MVGAKSFLAVGVAVLACASSALADNPTVRITKGDQAKAVASLLRLTDFGAGWTGGSQTPSKLTAPSCPGFDPKESDLTVSGHADALFEYKSGGVIFEQDTQVLASQQAVATDFSRTVNPKLGGCLAYQLKKSGNGDVADVKMSPLSFPHVGNVSAAYRANMLVRSHGREEKWVNDYIFFGQGRLEYSLSIVAPAVEAGQLRAFEQAMVRILITRAPSGNVA